MTPLPVCKKCRAIRTDSPDQICGECQEYKKLRYDRDVFHSCPKLRRGIVIDTKQTKKCLSCGFPVHKLAIRSHNFFRHAQVGHFVPIVFYVLMITFTDINSWIVIAIMAPMFVATFFVSQYLISQNSLNWHQATSQESFNWTMRKR